MVEALVGGHAASLRAECVGLVLILERVVRATVNDSAQADFEPAGTSGLEAGLSSSNLQSAAHSSGRHGRGLADLIALAGLCCPWRTHVARVVAIHLRGSAFEIRTVALRGGYESLRRV